MDEPLQQGKRMTTIIVTHEDNEVDEYEFSANSKVIAIGRRSSNDVCIPNLSVSGLHAKIKFDASGALIEDLNSTNGTYVNGRLISRQLLDEDDEIIIGKTRVALLLDDIHLPKSSPGAVAHDVNTPAPAAAKPRTTADKPHEYEAIEPTLLATNVPLPSKPQMAEPETESDLSSPAPQFLDDAKPVNSSRQNTASIDNDDAGLHDDDRLPENDDDGFDEIPMTLSERAKVALGRPARPTLKAVSPIAEESNSDTAVAVATPVTAKSRQPHPLDGLEERDAHKLTHELDSPKAKPASAVIEIKNGAKSGQVLPIDKPVTTLGRPGIQIAAIMRKPDGYFLMHIESDDSVDRPTLNRDSIGDEPVLLHSGDQLNVAGIDVEFMLS